MGGTPPIFFSAVIASTTMKPSHHRLLAIGSMLFLLPVWPSLLFAAPEYPVAGLAPSQRPAQAPRIDTELPLDKAVALRGVSEPLPASLKFLDQQGGWFTPFNHPGMPPPYDLRGWHATLPGKTK